MSNLSTWDESPPVKVGVHVTVELIDEAGQGDGLDLHHLGEIDLPDPLVPGNVDQGLGLHGGQGAAFEAVAKRPAKEPGQVGEQESETVVIGLDSHHI